LLHAANRRIIGVQEPVNGNPGLWQLQASSNPFASGTTGGTTAGTTGGGTQMGNELSLCYPTNGRVKSVPGPSALQGALNAAQAGDHLVLAAGNYNGSYSIKKTALLQTLS
jgi:hypothetical protein